MILFSIGFIFRYLVFVFWCARENLIKMPEKKNTLKVLSEWGGVTKVERGAGAGGAAGVGA